MLRDWEVEVHGASNVGAANAKVRGRSEQLMRVCLVSPAPSLSIDFF